MSLRKTVLEQAVTGLLCPRHYEYLLFLRGELEKDPSERATHRHKAAVDIIKMVRSARPSIPALGVADALHVLNEALKRLD
jgi:hypothetical protein